MIALAALTLPLTVWFSAVSNSAIPAVCMAAVLAWMWLTSPAFKAQQIRRVHAAAQREEDLRIAAIACDYIARHGEAAYRGWVAAKTPVAQQKYTRAERYIDIR